MFDNVALSLRQCQQWLQRFLNVDESLEDESLGAQKLWIRMPWRRPSSWTWPKTCDHITIENHLHGMDKANRCDKWVPLTDVNKATRSLILEFSSTAAIQKVFRTLWLHRMKNGSLMTIKQESGYGSTEVNNQKQRQNPTYIEKVNVFCLME